MADWARSPRMALACWEPTFSSIRGLGGNLAWGEQVKMDAPNL